MNEFPRKNVGRKAALIIFCMMMMSNVSAFVSHATRGGLCGTGSSQFIGRKMQIGGMPQRNSNRRKKTTELKMLLGSDAGVFGVGAPEIVSRYLQNALPFYSAWFDVILNHCCEIVTIVFPFHSFTQISTLIYNFTFRLSITLLKFFISHLFAFCITVYNIHYIMNGTCGLVSQINENK